ncbi:hypothetical protein [Saccharopolyspora pogona]|nr:hypothetical protein [Saccharopolyspora pogona]
MPIALPDAFLDAGALPTLYERYGLATDTIVGRSWTRSADRRAVRSW